MGRSRARKGEEEEEKQLLRHSYCYAISTDFTGTLHSQGWHREWNRSSGSLGKLSWKDSQGWHPSATLLSITSSYSLNSSSGLSAGTQWFIFKDAALYFVGSPIISPQVRNQTGKEPHWLQSLKGSSKMSSGHVKPSSHTAGGRSLPKSQTLWFSLASPQDKLGILYICIITYTHFYMHAYYVYLTLF